MTFLTLMGNFVLTSPSVKNRPISQSFPNDDSPFTQLQLNMVYTFPLDYIHRGCLCVMNNILQKWRDYFFSKENVLTLNKRMGHFKSSFPDFPDFQRKGRLLEDVHYWRAAELRSFYFTVVELH
jgi:hypothetical protein